MPCMNQTNETPARRSEVADAVKRLEQALAAGTVKLRVGAQGGIAFTGWLDNRGVSDLCAYRALAAANSPALRKAQARAEAMAGRKIEARTIAAGVHSHDGGHTWHGGH